MLLYHTHHQSANIAPSLVLGTFLSDSLKFIPTFKLPFSTQPPLDNCSSVIKRLYFHWALNKVLFSFHIPHASKIAQYLSLTFDYVLNITFFSSIILIFFFEILALCSIVTPDSACIGRGGPNMVLEIKMGSTA